MEGHACREGFEDALARELGRSSAREVRRFPGLVLVEPAEGAPRADPAFSNRVLPDARVVEADSVGKLVRGAFEAVAPLLDRSTAPWALSTIALEANASRADLVAKELLALMKEKLRRAFRRMGPQGDLLQLALPERGVVVASFVTPSALPSGFVEPRLPVEIPPDKTAPSSAYRKVEEAYLLLGEAPKAGERVVDLGAAPGGWSWTALKRGATVTSVDKADLLPPVAGAVTHLRKDAFSWEPEAPPVDWLLCDAIAAPDRSIGLLERWLSRKWCRRFVVNVKFKGKEDYARIDEVRALLARNGAVRARVKQLAADKNEVTVLGAC
ncbi:MAG: SAM-dependent methyltransferase [Planctomycetota bacterium]